MQDTKCIITDDVTITVIIIVIIPLIAMDFSWYFEQAFVHFTVIIAKKLLSRHTVARWPEVSKVKVVPVFI
jgi:hypothetical protein